MYQYIDSVPDRLKNIFQPTQILTARPFPLLRKYPLRGCPPPPHSPPRRQEPRDSEKTEILSVKMFFFSKYYTYRAAKLNLTTF